MDAAPRSAKRQRAQCGGSGAAASSGGGEAASGPLAGVAVFVRRNSLHSGAQLDAWKRSVPALGGTVIESDTTCSTATHAVVPSGSRGGWACLPAALRPGSASLPSGLQYVAEHWLAACIKSRARVPERDYAPAAAAAAGIATPAAGAAAGAAAAAAGAAAIYGPPQGAATAAAEVAGSAAAAEVEPAAAAGAAAAQPCTAGVTEAVADASCGPPGDGNGSGSGSGNGSVCSSDDGEEERSGEPGRCSQWYAQEAGRLRFTPERHPDDHVTWSLLSWNIWDVLDRQCLEPRALDIGREVERNEFPDAILLQEVSERMLGLLSRQPWLGAYHRSPLPGGIGRCCTMILLRKDRVGPPPGHSEVQWLEPFVCSLNDTRLDVGFRRDVKGVRCTILGRPVRISTTHIIHDAGGRRQQREITCWLSREDVVYRDVDPDHFFAGDFNWHRDYTEPMPLPPGWVDVWPLLMPQGSGHTWSSLARTGRATGGARLDRVVAKLHSFRPIQMDNLTGSEPIEGAVRLRRTRAGQAQEIAAYASDHRGLFTRFQLV